MSFLLMAAAALGPIYDSLGEAMTWNGAGPLQVILDQDAPDVDFGRSKARMAVITLTVRKSDVASPQAGDVAVFGARTFTLLSDAEPELDPQSLEWTCEAKES